MAQTTKERLGIAATISLVSDAIVHVWDWWTRTSGLDPYFGAQKNTFWGHVLSYVFNVSPLLFVIAFIVFGLLWALEPRLAKRFKNSVSESGPTLEPAGQRSYEHMNTILLQQLEEARSQRDAAQLALAVAQQQAITVFVSSPLLKGHVERFEPIDANYFTQWEREDLRRTLGREPTFHETFEVLVNRPPSRWYIAWLQIETTGTPGKAANWSFSVNHKDGAIIQCDLFARDWGAPASWPNISFYNITAVQSMFLENHHVYNVLVHVRCSVSGGQPTSENQLNMNSFKARFTDDNGVEIVCAMRQPGVGE